MKKGGNYCKHSVTGKLYLVLRKDQLPETITLGKVICTEVDDQFKVVKTNVMLSAKNLIVIGFVD